MSGRVSRLVRRFTGRNVAQLRRRLQQGYRDSVPGWLVHPRKTRALLRDMPVRERTRMLAYMARFVAAPEVP